MVPVIIKRHRDKNNGHRHIILENIDDRHVSICITSDPKKGRTSTNYKCQTDILGSGKLSYLRRQGYVEPIADYFGPKKRKMAQTDYLRAKVYGERAKQRYLISKKKK
ncbi:MAG: hypothetical protein IJD51_06135 [Clostridia bacterium]|nr:hypothetical protein [Clostridia bacterium]